MEWISNARFKQNVDEGTIFKLKGFKRGISIHKIYGLGDALYLSCHELGITKFGLNTEDFNLAVENAKVIIRTKMEMLNDDFVGFLSDESENVIVRY